MKKEEKKVSTYFYEQTFKVEKSNLQKKIALPNKAYQQNSKNNKKH